MLCPEARLSRAGFLVSFWDGTSAAQAGLRVAVAALGGLHYGIAFRKQNLHFSLSTQTKISNPPPLRVFKQVMKT